MSDPRNQPLNAAQMTALIQECLDRQLVHLQPGVIDAGVGRDQDTYSVLRDLIKEVLIVGIVHDCNLIDLVHEVAYMSHFGDEPGKDMRPIIKALNPLVERPWPVR